MKLHLIYHHGNIKGLVVIGNLTRIHSRGSFATALNQKRFEKANPEQQHCKADKKEEDSASSKQAGEDENDETRWKRLDAHDKRKEYKRARKVLDVLNE